VYGSEHTFRVPEVVIKHNVGAQKQHGFTRYEVDKVCVCLHICMCVWACMFVCMCLCMCVCVYVCEKVHVCVCMSSVIVLVSTHHLYCLILTCIRIYYALFLFMTI
jgi:hypothetical protein